MVEPENNKNLAFGLREPQQHHAVVKAEHSNGFVSWYYKLYGGGVTKQDHEDVRIEMAGLVTAHNRAHRAFDAQKSAETAQAVLDTNDALPRTYQDRRRHQKAQKMLQFGHGQD